MSVGWPFVGRADELRLIRDAMAGPTGVVLAGPAGVGKTRLAYEAVGGADPRRFVTQWVVATAATTSIPLGALAPLLPVDLPSAINRVDLLRRAADALLDRCGARRLVLGIDDAHLLDEISAALVHQLAHTRRAFVLASLRSRESAPDPITALWKEELVTRIEVQALSHPQTHDVLVAALGGQVDGVTSRRLWDAARGNMLLLREMVNAGLDGGALSETSGVWHWAGPWVMAPRLTELITARIGRLDPQEHEVMEILAYGEPLGADLLIGLTDERAVEDVEVKSLIWARRHGRRTDVRLAHPLYGELLRACCPALRARRLRRRLADAVEATGARRKDDWLRIATWRLDASEPVRPEVLVAAARRAFAVLDWGLAERLARTAFDAGDSAAGEVLWRVVLFRPRDAEVEGVMAQLAAAPMSDEQRGEYVFGQAYHLFWGLDRPDDAKNLLRVTRGLISDRMWRDEIDFLLCVFCLLEGNATSARRCIAAMRARPQLSERAAAQAQVAEGMALVHLGRLAEATAVLDQAAEPIARWTDQIPWVDQGRRQFRCFAALFAGRLAEAAELATQFYAHAVEGNWTYPLRLACAVQAITARLLGRVRTAARWAREGQRVYQDVAFRGYVLGELAHAEALAGRAAKATTALAEADRMPTRSTTLYQPWTELARTWVAVASGHRARAVELSFAAAEYAKGQHAVGFEAFALHDAVRLGSAPDVVDRLQELAESIDSDLAHIFAHHAAAAATGDAGRLLAVGADFEGMGAALLAAEAFIQEDLFR